ncbi:MAG: adenylate kinase family protein [Akkermansiaceae bacterium]
MTELSLVFLGPPASGKGTQGRRLAEQSCFSYLSTGGLLRTALRERTELGVKARPFLDRGEYLPDAIMVPMVLAWLSETPGKVILDGFPRTVAQGVALDRAFEESSRILPKAVFLDVPFDELKRRVQGRLECSNCHWVTSKGTSTTCSKCEGEMVFREDDDLERFKNRFDEFERLTAPLLSYYEERQKLIRVSAVGSPDSIHGEILTQLSH